MISLDPEGFNELKLCRSGWMIYNKHDWFIGRALQKYGESCWQEIEVLRMFVKPDMMVVDAGANIGTHTIELSKMAKYVIAFEPQTIAFQTLCANMMLNHRANVRAIQAILGKTNGRLHVPVRNQNVENNFGGVVLGNETEGELIEVVKLDQFDFPCGFIKIDVEGMELDVLLGGARLIAQHRPLLYVETEGTGSKEVRELLFNWDYDCYWHIAPLFNEDNFFGEKENVFMFKEQHYICPNLLCIPKENNVTVVGLPKMLSIDETVRDAQNNLKKAFHE